MRKFILACLVLVATCSQSFAGCGPFGRFFERVEAKIEARREARQSTTCQANQAYTGKCLKFPETQLAVYASPVYFESHKGNEVSNTCPNGQCNKQVPTGNRTNLLGWIKK